MLPKEKLPFVPDLFIYSIFIYVSNGLMHIYFIHWVIIQYYCYIFLLKFCRWMLESLFSLALVSFYAIYENNLYYLVEETSFKIFIPPLDRPLFCLIEKYSEQCRNDNCESLSSLKIASL